MKVITSSLMEAGYAPHEGKLRYVYICLKTWREYTIWKPYSWKGRWIRGVSQWVGSVGLDSNGFRFRPLTVNVVINLLMSKRGRGLRNQIDEC